MGALRDLVDAGAVARALAGARRFSGDAPILHLRKAWPAGRLPLVALYGEERDGEPDSLWWTVAALPEGRVPAALQKALKNGTATALPELNAAALRFPHDRELTRLAEVIDPRQAGERLAPWSGTSAPPVVELLGYKPARRLVVRYHQSDGSAGATPFPGEAPGRASHPDHGREASLIGKCYRPGRDEEALAIHAALQTGGKEARIDGLEVPAPCGRVEEWRMLVWRPSGGRSFHDLMEAPEAPELARRIGRGLAVLQGSGAGWERRHTPGDELGVVTRWTNAAAAAYPGLAEDLRRATDNLQRTADLIIGSDETSASRLVPSHRDFFDKQLLVDDKGIVLLDLDTACRAEPELDPGNFLAHLRLRRLQGRKLSLQALREAFLEGLRRGAVPFDDRQLGYYEACTLTRLAAVYAFRPRWSALTGELLAAARAIISDSAQQRRSMHVV